jgi:dihydrolipoamide dehydrogenase
VIDDHSGWSRLAATADHYMIQVLFTDPQAASEGLTEKESKRLELNTRSIDSEMGMVVGAQLPTDGKTGHRYRQKYHCGSNIPRSTGK